jgi:outer membrane protein assembly factor BamB
MANEELVYIGIKGKVIALSRATGEMAWSANLDAGFLNTGFVHVVVDGNDVFATTQGEVSCLDAATGQIRWQNPLRGYGMGIASIATRNVCSPADLAAQIIAQQQTAAATSGAAH